MLVLLDATKCLRKKGIWMMIPNTPLLFYQSYTLPQFATPKEENTHREEAPSWTEIECVLSYKKKDQCSVSYMRLLLPRQTWYPIPSPHQLQHPNPIGKINLIGNKFLWSIKH
jgi:hypothetical protein